jgi:hypothetical protein
MKVSVVQPAGLDPAVLRLEDESGTLTFEAVEIDVSVYRPGRLVSWAPSPESLVQIHEVMRDA